MKTSAKVAIGLVAVGAVGGLAYYLWSKRTVATGTDQTQLTNAFASASSVSNAGLPTKAETSFGKSLHVSYATLKSAQNLPCDTYQNGILTLC